MFSSVFTTVTSTTRRLLYVTSLLLIVHQSVAAAASGKEGKLFFQTQPSADGRTVVVEAGKNVVLECEAAGRPSPVIHWLRNGVPLNQVDEGHVLMTSSGDAENAPLELSTTKSRLFIDCAVDADSAVYTCVAETTSQRIAASSVVVVEPPTGLTSSSDNCLRRHSLMSLGQVKPARINMWTSMTLDYEGATARLFCRAQGNPAPTVSWFDKYNRRIEDNDSKFSVLDNGDLLVRDVSWKKHMGIYRCVAQNGAGSDQTETFLYPTQT